MDTPCHAPIVLVHGLLGFDRICVGKLELKRYFPGIEERLIGTGRPVRVARLSRTRGIATRAQELRRFIRQEFPTQRVHVFAHSMGGLDARYMISKLDMADCVLSLTTIGTPHRGTAFADWGIRRAAWIARPFLRALSICGDAFYDLTTESCRRFNEEVLDVPGVRYSSIAGSRERGGVGLMWRLPWQVVFDQEGANDGIVSVASAHHGESCDVWDADHMNLVNWPSRWASRHDFSHNYVNMAAHIE